MNNVPIEMRIKDILQKQEPLTRETVVWRGHAAGPDTISADTWFSTTSSQRVAKNLFVGSTGVLFKIHLMPGIRALNVGNALNRANNRSRSNRNNRNNRTRSNRNNRHNMTIRNMVKEEQEWIVEGGGIFYKDKNARNPGFEEHDDFVETYYAPAPTLTTKRTLTSNEVIERIDPMEYNMIDGPNYIRNFILKANNTVSNTNMNAVLRHISKSRNS